jgi:hypothetical protein
MDEFITECNNKHNDTIMRLKAELDAERATVAKLKDDLLLCEDQLRAEQNFSTRLKGKFLRCKSRLNAVFKSMV